MYILYTFANTEIRRTGSTRGRAKNFERSEQQTKAQLASRARI